MESLEDVRRAVVFFGLLSQVNALAELLHLCSHGKPVKLFTVNRKPCLLGLSDKLLCQFAPGMLEDLLGRPVFIDDALGEEQHAGAHFAGEGPGTAAPDQRVQQRTDEPGYQEIEVCTCLR